MSTMDGTNDPPADRSPQRAPMSAADTEAAYAEVYNDPQFIELRRRFRSFVFPVTIGFLAWYFLYVLLAAFAPGFMSIKVFGNINIGLLLGLGQFVSTFAITMLYRSWADKKFDPKATELREHIEGPTR